MKMKFILLFIAISFTQAACKLVDDERGDLVSATRLSKHSLSTMKSALINSKFNAKYAVKTYKIVYTTFDVDGDLIDASGLLAVPQKRSSRKSPILVDFHKTITENRNAPSHQFKATHILSKAASLGYIVIAPDYLGYGKSRREIHPYMHAKTLASATIDMIRASKKWLKKHDRKINKQIFLEGYGEGGYAAMATHKKIEKSHSKEFKITASVPAGGPYDLSTSFTTLLDEDTLHSPVTIGYIIKAYDHLYESGLVEKAINSKYQNVVNKYITDGGYDTQEINDLLDDRTRTLMKYNFLIDIRDGVKTRLIKKLKNNNIYDWKPKGAMRVIHAEEDEVFPYDNAVTTVDKMIANGATDIELIDCDVSPWVAKHGICSTYANDYAISYFFSLADDL